MKEEPCPGASCPSPIRRVVSGAMETGRAGQGRAEGRDAGPGNRQALPKLMHFLKSTLPVTIVPKNPEDQVGVEERGLAGQKAEPEGKVRAAFLRGI